MLPLRTPSKLLGPIGVCTWRCQEERSEKPEEEVIKKDQKKMLGIEDMSYFSIKISPAGLDGIIYTLFVISFCIIMKKISAFRSIRIFCLMTSVSAKL